MFLCNWSYMYVLYLYIFRQIDKHSLVNLLLNTACILLRVSSGSLYYKYKDFFHIVLLAIVDSDYKIV